MRAFVSPSMTSGSNGAASLPPLAGAWSFVGDVHGELEHLPVLGHPVVQVGDMGIGFVTQRKDADYVASRDDLWFIRGNHDHPDLCRSHSRYLGDWGAHEFMFWVSGAWSIDYRHRVEGRDWWRDEELSTADGQRAYEAYLQARPRVMVTHDGPSSLFGRGGPMPLRHFFSSSTTSLLQAMFEAHRPEVWLFGHHHESHDFMHGGTRFRCLASHELATLQLSPTEPVLWLGEQA